MYGSGWRKFYDDNMLGKGQMVVFFLDEPSPRAAICVIQVGNGSEDEQPMEEGDPIEDSDSDDEDGEASSDDGEGIVRTRGLLLTETEGFQLQGLLPLSDDFIGFPFVHRLTKTDNCLGMMRENGRGRKPHHGAATSKVSAAELAGDEMLGDACEEMLGDPRAPPESSRPADECLMDARMQIEREIETKTKSSLKEGLGQQLKTDHMEESKDLTRDCLNKVPHTGIAFEVEGGKPGSDRNEEGGDKLC